MKSLLSLFLVMFSLSCIPVRIAPSIEDYRLGQGRKFKRSLSKRHMFIFEDPKAAGHFYHYVDTKFQLNNQSVYDDVPFEVNGAQYFFAFYEIEIPTKILNLGPALFNTAVNQLLNNEENDNEYIHGEDIVRKDNWYIAIEVYSDLEKDCLQPKSLSRVLVLKYLRLLKNEYLTTHNYNETVFKN